MHAFLQELVEFGKAEWKAGLVEVAQQGCASVESALARIERGRKAWLEQKKEGKTQKGSKGVTVGYEMERRQGGTYEREALTLERAYDLHPRARERARPEGNL